MARSTPLYLTISGVLVAMVACSADMTEFGPAQLSSSAQFEKSSDTKGAFQFAALGTSAVCTSGGDAVNPLVIPAGFGQVAVASEPSYADSPDMNTLNETGPQAGRYLYRVHEVGSNGSLSVTDLVTGVTKTIAQRADWESLDPTVWTPWGTLLFAEETNAANFRDPAYPASVAGLVYEVFFNPGDLTVVDSVLARPAIGSKSHEGMRFDPQGNLYSISERTPGYLFKFVPDKRGNLSRGQTFVLRITQADGDRTGAAEWIPLPRTAVQIDASAAADLVQATGYGRPEDVEVATSTGNNAGGANTLYVSITSEHRVLAVDLREPKGGSDHSTAFITQYVKAGVNAPADFEMPDNLALDRSGNLYIAEDPGGSFNSGKRKGDDIWVATPNRGGQHGAAVTVTRFATLTDCDAEPTGIYFDLHSSRLFVNIQHRGGDHLDKTMAVFAAKP
ncbi:MAG: alkaline phosphatase PhoX [bacterium]